MTHPRRIYINGRFLTQRVTGIQRYARETLSELDALLGEGAGPADVEWHLLAPSGTSFPSLRNIRVQAVGRLHGHAWEQLDLPRFSRNGLLLSFASTGPLAKGSQIITVHDASVYQVPGAFSWKFRTWHRFIVRRVVARSARALAVSNFAASELVAWFGGDPQKITITSEGWQHLARQQADVGILAQHGLEAGRYVLAVSSPTPNKNFGLVVRAAEALRDSGVMFAIAGSTDAGVFSSGAVATSSQVKMLGYVSDQELKALYQNAMCFVFPSRYEGFGIPPLEAMSLGCPVIASRISSVTEVCGDAAQYFDPDRHDEVVELVQRLASTPSELASMRAAGLARAPHYSWREAAQRTLDAVLQMVA